MKTILRKVLVNVLMALIYLFMGKAFTYAFGFETAVFLLIGMVVGEILNNSK